MGNLFEVTITKIRNQLKFNTSIAQRFQIENMTIEQKLNNS